MLAATTGQPMTRVVADAVDALERRIFFEALYRRYQELRDDPDLWSEIEGERHVEESALRDRSD